MVQIVIVEPQPLVRLGLTALLGCLTSSDQIKSQSYDDLYQSSPSSTPCNLVILGARPEERIRLLIQAARHAHSPKRMVLMSEPSTTPPSWTDLPSLVIGYISMSWSAESIVDALQPFLPNRHSQRKAYDHQTAHRHRPLQPISVPRHPLTSARPKWDMGLNIEVDEARMLGITPRQYEVLVLLAQGYPIKLICRRLDISIATTKGHLEALYQRLGVHNRNEAVFVAMAQGATLQVPVGASPRHDMDDHPLE